jgi:hypothetical protein
MGEHEDVRVERDATEKGDDIAKDAFPSDLSVFAAA